MIYITKTWICDKCGKVKSETYSLKYSETAEFNDPTMVDAWGFDPNYKLICNKCLLEGEENE